MSVQDTILRYIPCTSSVLGSNPGTTFVRVVNLNTVYMSVNALVSQPRHVNPFAPEYFLQLQSYRDENTPK